MEFIEWSEEYAMGVPLIDAQHKKLFSIINDYHKTQISTEDAFAELVSYIDFHFKTEEYYFEKFEYKNSAEHIAGHRYYQDKIAEMHELFLKNRGNDSVRSELEEFIRDWIQGHIKVKDMMYRACFMEHGLGIYGPEVH